MTHATTIRIRPATAADLPRVAGIWHEAQMEDADQAPVAPEGPSPYLHELEHGELHVLERDGQVLAFGALLQRGSVRFLADLFVARAKRSSGLGRRLLQHLLGRNSGSSCTISSSDRRARTARVRAGLRPTWPHLSLLADLDALRPPPEHRLDVVPADPGDQRLVRWDRVISDARVPRTTATGCAPAAVCRCGSWRAPRWSATPTHRREATTCSGTLTQ